MSLNRLQFLLVSVFAVFIIDMGDFEGRHLRVLVHVGCGLDDAF